MGPVIFDYNKRLILLSVIQLSGGHCSNKIMQLIFDYFIGLPPVAQKPIKWAKNLSRNTKQMWYCRFEFSK